MRLPFPILLKYYRCRIDNHYAGIAVDDDPVVLLDHPGSVIHPDRGRNVQAARHNRRM